MRKTFRVQSGEYYNVSPFRFCYLECLSFLGMTVSSFRSLALLLTWLVGLGVDCRSKKGVIACIQWIHFVWGEVQIVFCSISINSRFSAPLADFISSLGYSSNIELHQTHQTHPILSIKQQRWRWYLSQLTCRRHMAYYSCGCSLPGQLSSRPSLWFDSFTSNADSPRNRGITKISKLCQIPVFPSNLTEISRLPQ